MTTLQVAREFSPYLGGRYRDDGPWSGEQFRDEMLRPRLLEAIQQHATLHINFDGVAGMPPSFLEEAFGGLLRTVPGLELKTLNERLKLDAEDPELWPFLKLAQKFMEHQAERPH